MHLKGRSINGLVVIREKQAARPTGSPPTSSHTQRTQSNPTLRLPTTINIPIVSAQKGEIETEDDPDLLIFENSSPQYNSRHQIRLLFVLTPIIISILPSHLIDPVIIMLYEKPRHQQQKDPPLPKSNPSNPP
ncbi:hypothetical protein K402DRAFT_169090 [Aulographum hederae CBS 113979]|uniref:Uncharacterized protein n=1 Tax=Aulographum hederae CBS 113979 TaxID=1176131 RepID=A0A6G1HCN9_9PEZI|nr:hypothetical protein K402DRAFT_169090 [Aulographum hederae CBS 113979]